MTKSDRRAVAFSNLKLRTQKALCRLVLNWAPERRVCELLLEANEEGDISETTRHRRLT
jgi:hypothetical protein